jgi:N-acetylglucosaminyldiphosphoundecaprenol N-acetyl-beta-D-mannosaminyltransferase
MHTAASARFRSKPNASQEARTSNVEFWVAITMLLATIVFPAIAKYHAGGDADGPMSSPIGQVTWSALYLLAGFRLYALRVRALPILKKSIALGALLGYMLLSLLWSVQPTTTLYNGIELIGTALIAYYLVVRFTLREFLEILAVTFAMVGVISLAMIFLAPGHARMDYGSGAWTGLFQEKNNLAAAMALGIISLFALMLEARSRSRLLALGALLLCIVLLVGSKSATATAGTLFAIGVMLVGLVFRSPKIGVGGRIAIVMTFVLAAGAIWVFGLTPGSFLGVVGRDANLTGRTDFWPYLQQAISDRPMLGYGYDAFFRSPVGRDYLSDYVVEAGGWSPYHSHNSFLQVCLDGGFVGLALLLGVLGIAIVRGMTFIGRAKEKTSVWPLAIVVYLIVGSFTETYLNQINTFEMIFFVAALLYPLRDASASKERSSLNKSVRATSAWIAGVRIDSHSFSDVVSKIVHRVSEKHPMEIVVTPNAHHVVLLQDDPRLREIYNEAFLVVPDGVPLLWSARWLKQPLNGRVNGTDLFEKLCAVAAERSLSVYLLGGREGAADAAAARLRERHPNLIVGGTYCPPFGFERDAAESAKIVDQINAARPDFLFVGLGAPKQEYWMHENRSQLRAKMALGIGVSFEFVGGVVARAPRWMQIVGLEWFFRLMCEPKRMWKRYLIGNARFCALVARQRFTMRSTTATQHVRA